MNKSLQKVGLEVINALPPYSVIQYIKSHEFAKSNSRFLSFLRKIEKTPFVFLVNILLRLRHYTIPKHGPRVISAKKI